MAARPQRARVRLRLTGLLAVAAACAAVPPTSAVASNGTITTAAGNPTLPGSGLNIGQLPVAVSPAPSGALYIADTDSSTLRMLSASGQETTVVGNGSRGYSGDGAAAGSAQLNQPASIAVDASGNVLIADRFNAVVRLVAGSDCSSACPFGLPAMTQGDIYTIAGTGSYGFAGDNGPGTSAQLTDVSGVALNSRGDALIADRNNQRVRLIAASSCSGTCPYGLAAMSAGNIYTIAGNGTAGFAGDGGSATGAELNGPAGIALDSTGDVMIADLSNNRVRMLAAASCSSSCPYGLATTTPGRIYTIAGNGTAGYTGDNASAATAELNGPSGVGTDVSGDVLIADRVNSRVRLVAASTCTSSCPYGLAATTAGSIYTIAGSGVAGFAGDGGSGRTAQLNVPSGVNVDAGGDVLVADTGNDRVRLLAAAGCSSACPYGLAATTAGHLYTVAGNGSTGFGGDGGPAASAEVDRPAGTALDGQSDLVIADQDSNRIRLVAAADCSTDCPFGLSATTAGDIYTIAGTGTAGFAGDNGPARAAQLFGPAAVALDASGDLLIADQDNRRVRLLAALSCSSGCPFGLSATTAGNIYTIAGDGVSGATGDGGRATAAELASPTGLAVDSHSDVVIADRFNQRIRLVAGADCAGSCPYRLTAMTAGDIYTIAGRGGQGYNGDSQPAAGALLNDPTGVAVDRQSNLLVGDQDNERVRLIAAADCTTDCPYGLPATTAGDIYTLAGTGTPGLGGDGGAAIAAQLNAPAGVTVDGRGDVVIADTGNNRVRLIAMGDCSHRLSGWPARDDGW